MNKTREDVIPKRFGTKKRRVSFIVNMKFYNTEGMFEDSFIAQRAESPLSKLGYNTQLRDTHAGP
jgi:hypothetical protein